MSNLTKTIIVILVIVALTTSGFTSYMTSQTVFAQSPNLSIFVNDQTVSSFSGPQIVQVVVDDPLIAATDMPRGEPDVTVNGKDLRMVQGIDGKWYGFFADINNALLADFGVVTAGTGLDFGVFCSQVSGFSVLGVDVSDTLGFAIQDPDLVSNEVNGNPDGTPLTNACTDPNPTASPNDLMSVLNDEVAINPFPSVDSAGQIGIKQGFWPFIQLNFFNLNGQVVIQYNKGGPPQIETLSFVSSVLVVGGEGIPIDTTALLIAGFNANSIWMIPTVLGLIGAGLVIQLVRRKKSENS